MNDLEEKLKSFLSSPDSMEKVLNIMKSMSGSEPDNTEQEFEPVSGEDINSEPLQPVSALAESKPGKDPSGLFNAFDSFDPKTISMAMQIMNEYNCKNDRRIHLLNALRPYFKTGEQGHIEKAVQIIKLAKVAKKALHNFSGGDTNV